MTSGTGYKNDKACATFVEFIAKEQQNLLVSALSRSKFFSFRQMLVLTLAM